MKNESCPSVQAFYTLVNPFGYLELDVCVTPGEDLFIDGWVGASIRNNLLYAADSICVVGAVPLRQIIDILTIRQHHPLYDEMKGGFPRGFGIVLKSHESRILSCRLKKGEPLRFSILLYGHYTGYHAHFIEAIKQMCKRGIGTPITPLQIVKITTKPFVCISDFTDKKCRMERREITIRYTVPINLYRGNPRYTPGIYTDRQHEFPGFYQLVRSAVYRTAKLKALYTCPEETEFYPQLEEVIDSFTRYAVTVLLTSAQLKRVEIPSTLKKETPNRIQLAGYTGELTFAGNFNYYLPLLLFAQSIGVGSHTTYGLGRYEIVEPVIQHEV